MSFVVPSEADWPLNYRRGIVPGAYILAGPTSTSGPSGVLLADRWVRAHSQRVVASSGISIPLTTGYATTATLGGFIGADGVGLDIIGAWETGSASTTTLKITITYKSTGLSDVITLSSATVGVVVTSTTPSLTNYVEGECLLIIEAKNTVADSTLYGVEIRQTPLLTL